MVRKRNITIGILVVAICILGLGIIQLTLGPRGTLSGFDKEMHAKYHEISNGESVEAVIRTLGQPRLISDTCNLPQRHGFEHIFEAAENSEAVEYYQWINGGNWYYCIGFDSSRRVVIKGEGHS